ncbi:MAG: alpha/beta hydrolase [Acidimicrobiia bacterium]
MKAHNGDVILDWEDRGEGPPLLLIHGLGYARWGWEPLAPLLAEHFRVITFDNRGIGLSSVPPGPYTAAQMATDALAVLDAAGAGRTHVAGTSLGGMIAQELAIDHPDRVDRLALLSTTPGQPDGYPMPEATVRLLEQASNWEPEVALRRFVENALGPAPDARLVDDILGHRLANPQDPAGWAAQAAAGTTYAGGDRCRAISAPTLVVSGTEDRVVDHANSHLLGELIPRATVRLVEGGGHLVFWEHPRLVANMIVEFLT